MAVLIARVFSRACSRRVFLRYLQLVTFVLAIGQTTPASTFPVFGPQNYTRGTGKPITTTSTFTAPKAGPFYLLQVTGTQGSAATISLNGVILLDQEFSSTATALSVSLLASNGISVTQQGKPGSRVNLVVLGIDNAPPQITAAATPAPNAAGWNNSNVTVTFSCTDDFSGIASCSPPMVLSTEGEGQVITGTAVDRAGNTATTSVTVNLDKTPPSVTITSPSTGAVLNTPSVTVTGSATDSLSGVAMVTCNGVAAMIATGSFSCNLTLVTGSNTIKVQATDAAGNTGTTSATVTLTSAPGFTIGGTVSGLSGTGLVLQDNGGDSLPVSGNGTFTFAAALVNQTMYVATVSTQPAAQICSVLNGIGIVASANVTNILVRCISPPAGGAGVLPSSGGTVSTPAATVTAPSGASVMQQNLTITAVAPPPGLPLPLASVGAAIDITVGSPAAINAPFLITLPYDPTGIADENQMAVVHYDTTNKRYEPVTVLSHDTTAHSFVIESRVFSPFSIVTFVDSLLDTSHTAGAPNNLFTPAANGWNIMNFGSPFAGGQCLGMAAYATWFFDNMTGPLFNEFDNSGQCCSDMLVPSIAQLVAVRAMLGQSQYFSKKSTIYLNMLGPAITGELMKMYIDVFNQPLILNLGVGGPPLHAGVVYGYDSASFTFYDVNFVGVKQNVSFDGTNFGNYMGYTNITFDAIPSLGRTEDFAALTTDALQGFPTSSLISVTSPMPDQQVSTSTVPLMGTQSIDPSAFVVAYANDQQIQLPVNSGGSFSGTLPIVNDENTIVLLAGVNIFQQSNWAPNAATLIFDVTGCLQTNLVVTILPCLGGSWSGSVTVQDESGTTVIPVSASITATGSSFNATVVFTDETTGTPVVATGMYKLNSPSSPNVAGTLNISGTSVTWVSGSQFTSLFVNATLTINGIPYAVASVQSPTSLTLSQSAGMQSGVAYSGTLPTNFNLTLNGNEGLCGEILECDTTQASLALTTQVAANGATVTGSGTLDGATGNGSLTVAMNGSTLSGSASFVDNTGQLTQASGNLSLTLSPDGNHLTGTTIVSSEGISATWCLDKEGATPSCM